MSGSHEKRTPTLRDVAAAAGLSLAATSLALRGSGKVSAATRERVERLAHAMGYTPNPLAAAFQSAIRKGDGRRFQATIAWVNDRSVSEHWADHLLYEAARQRCEQLGYVLDVVGVDPSEHMDEPGWVAERIKRILRARGIHAAIFPDLHRTALCAEVWDGIAVVLIGNFEALLRRAKAARHRQVLYHCVRSDVGYNTRLAFENLEVRGARRIGMVLTQWSDEASGSSALARFLELTSKRPLKYRVPPLLTNDTVASTNPSLWRADFLRWIDRFKPDALLGVNDEILHWARESGRKIPEDLQLAHLRVPQNSVWSGVNERDDCLGEAAVDLVSAHLVRNETGLPAYPKSVTIQGTWVDGTTAK